MSLPAKLVLVVLCCCAAVVFALLAQLIARRPISILRDLLAALTIVGLLSCLLAVMFFVLGVK